MNLLLWIVIGGVLGWLASIETEAGAPNGRLVNVLAGIAGALGAGCLASWPIGLEAIESSEFDTAALPVTPLGAIVLLATVNLLRLARIR